VLKFDIAMLFIPIILIFFPIGIYYLLKNKKIDDMYASDFPWVPTETFLKWRETEKQSISMMLKGSWGLVGLSLMTWPIINVGLGNELLFPITLLVVISFWIFSIRNVIIAAVTSSKSRILQREFKIESKLNRDQNSDNSKLNTQDQATGKIEDLQPLANRDSRKKSFSVLNKSWIFLVAAILFLNCSCFSYVLVKQGQSRIVIRGQSLSKREADIAFKEIQLMLEDFSNDPAKEFTTKVEPSNLISETFMTRFKENSDFRIKLQKVFAEVDDTKLLNENLASLKGRQLARKQVQRLLFATREGYQSEIVSLEKFFNSFDKPKLSKEIYGNMKKQYSDYIDLFSEISEIRFNVIDLADRAEPYYLKNQLYFKTDDEVESFNMLINKHNETLNSLKKLEIEIAASQKMSMSLMKTLF